MSFGVSIGDIIKVIEIAKNVIQDCRHAPKDFAEASRVVQSLYLLLKGVKTEYQNPDSPLHKVKRTRTDFTIHFKNCETSLKSLADLIPKFNSLGTPNKRLLDRMRFPKKDYLEYRGNLAFYTARLSESLQLVGLGSLGRIEQNVEDLHEHLPNLMTQIDKMCAEIRMMGDKESVLSDHTNDDKFVWKTFRSKLIGAGFTSNVLKEHEVAIFLYIRELTRCGLLDTDGSRASLTNGEVRYSSSPRHISLVRPKSMMSSFESESEFEKVITPEPSTRKIGQKASAEGGQSLYDKAIIQLNQPAQDGSEDGKSYERSLWRRPSNETVVDGRFLVQANNSKQSFAALANNEKQAKLKLRPNSDETDLDSKELAQNTAKNLGINPKTQSSKKRNKEQMRVMEERHNDPSISKASGRDPKSFGSFEKKDLRLPKPRHAAPGHP